MPELAITRRSEFRLNAVQEFARYIVVAGTAVALVALVILTDDWNARRK